MKILLRQAFVADPGSSFNGTTQDILIENGVVVTIDKSITSGIDNSVTIIEKPGLVVSPGWVDAFSHFCDPGLEHRETLESGAATAAAGGYTQVFTLPNTQPVVSNKTQVQYITQGTTTLPVTIRPLGTITKNAEGKELGEMYDMYNSGAVAFTDGLHPVQSPGLLLKALLYVKAFDGVLIQVPVDDSISKYGLMHEGIVSTRMGLPGIPAIGEELVIMRDIELVKYTGSKLHITGVSTAKGIALIKEAKAAGLQVTCSVTPYHLVFCDEDLSTYDTNLKVTPPLRLRSDMMALRQAVLEGVVDCLASHHLPQNWDNKTCEFEYAKAGMISLQTAYAAVQTALPELTPAQVAVLFGTNAAAIFATPTGSVTPGATASFTLFEPEATTVLTTKNNQSKSANSPFLDKTLKGKVTGIIHKGKAHLN
ncbi:dihydroorotase [Filimonas lacunae]|uniref:Dihydroorotase n=1 Tax=Filimonas lacunae TaxID=477680 RepID=A0A173MFQ6_9BACT|nr:dihydroorotase [Filimonas lacunae]BAV06268.1 dihydroorotase [Filimonas lacunae]SIT25564.1 dihydroorotase [Filimonas lacunae]